MNEFYVGYQPRAPQRLSRFLFRIAFGLAMLAPAVALLLVAGQQPFPEARFEFLQYRDYKGRLAADPYPRLLAEGGPYLLVAPGKHGASEMVRGFELREVHLSGSLIERGGDRMLEIVPGSLRATGPPGSADPPVDLGDVTLTGEVVDSKCYLGVMNPGAGKVHRDCAVRCISGGIPPALVVRDATGEVRVGLLAGVGAADILDFVAEPVTIRGRLRRAGATLILDAGGNTGAIQRH
jgi:hypothetical protein